MRRSFVSWIRIYINGCRSNDGKHVWVEAPVFRQWLRGPIKGGRIHNVMEIWMCNSGWLHAPSSGAGCSFHLKTTFRLKSKNPNAKTLLGLNYIFPGNLFIPNFIPQKQGLLVTAAEENARRYFYILFGCKTCLPSRFSLRIAFFRWENPTWAEPTASSLSVKLQNSCISIFSFFSLALFCFVYLLMWRN